MSVSVIIRFGDTNIVKSNHGNRKMAKCVDMESEGDADAGACLPHSSASSLGLIHLFNAWAHASVNGGGLAKSERQPCIDALQRLISSAVHNHDSAVWKLFITDDWAF